MNPQSLSGNLESESGQSKIAVPGLAHARASDRKGGRVQPFWSVAEMSWGRSRSEQSDSVRPRLWHLPQLESIW